MTGRAWIWLRRVAAAIAAFVLSLCAFGWWALGSETGSRWLVTTAIDAAPVELISDGISGTLLGELRIAALSLSQPDLSVGLAELRVDVNWPASSLRGIAVERLSADRVTVVTTGEDAAPSQPFELSMAPLPLPLRVADFALGSLSINDTRLTNLTVRNFGAADTQFAAAGVGLFVDRLELNASALSIDVDGDVPVAASLDWRLADNAWSGTGSVAGSLRRLEFEHRLAGEYPARSDGTVFILGEVAPSVDVTSTFEEWQYQDWIARAGSLRIRGSADAYETEFAGAIEHPEYPAGDVSGTVAGDFSGLQTIDVRAATPAADGSVAGRVAWSPALDVDIVIAATDVDPSTITPLAPGDLDAILRLTGSGAENFVLEIESLSGDYAGLPATARGSVGRSADVWSCAGCRLQVGDNRFELDGTLAATELSATVLADAPAMNQLWSGLAGALEADLKVSGTPGLPVVTGEASGNRVAVADWSVDTFSIDSRASSPERVDLNVEFGGLVSDESALGRGSLRLLGELDAVEFEGEWSLDDFSAAVTASLAIGDDGVRGRVNSAALTEPFSGTWRSTSPFGFEASTAVVAVSTDAAIWTNGDARLRLEPFIFDDEDLELSATLGNGPLGVANAFLPEEVRLEGGVDAAIQLQRLDDRWTGSFDWEQQGTRVKIFPQDDDALQFEVPVARARATLGASGLNAQMNVNAEPDLQMNITASLDELTSDGALEANMQLQGGDWRWVDALIPEIEDFGGDLSSDLNASGRVSAPDLNGSIRWRNGRLVVPALNLPLTDIDVELAGSSAGGLSIVGAANSGDGRLAVDGRVADIGSASPRLDMRLTGDRAALLGGQDYYLVASPDLTVVAGGGDIRVTGGVVVDEGEITVTELQDSAVTPSADVVVEGREETARRDTRLSGDLTLSLSDSVHVQAFGLDSNLTGDLRFVLAEDREPRAEGELNLVGGFFETYGQRLEIEHGTMLFNGPLDSPYVDVRAVRKIDGDATITVGIELRGRAPDLGATVFSEPALAEAEALSYLLTGRALADAGTADGNMLVDAAYSLGLRQAGAITNQIGQSIGLDELSLTGSNQNTMALVAGKQLTPKLHARYSYGVFDKLGELLLRYRLSDSLSVELGAGQAQSMDVLYTVERE